MFSCKLPVLFLASIGHFAGAQVDTFNIYKNKCGVRYRIYLHEWFLGFGIKHSYSWSNAKMNKQDSLVMEHNHPCYFKVLDKKGRLEFEGGRGSGSELQGELRYYYRTG